MPEISEIVSLEAVPRVAVASLAVALVSAACSLGSIIFTWKNWSLSKKKDDRGKQNVSVYYAEGFLANDDQGRAFAFLVTITNLADVTSSLVQSELWITYTSAQGAVLTLSLTPSSDALGAFPEIQDRAIVPPVRLDARQATTGWFGFRLPKGAVPLGGRIDGYEVRMLGPAGMIGSFKPLILIERVQGKKEINVDAAPKTEE